MSIAPSHTDPALGRENAPNAEIGLLLDFGSRRVVQPPSEQSMVTNSGSAELQRHTTETMRHVLRLITPETELVEPVAATDHQPLADVLPPEVEATQAPASNSRVADAVKTVAQVLTSPAKIVSETPVPPSSSSVPNTPRASPKKPDSPMPQAPPSLKPSLAEIKRQEFFKKEAYDLLASLCKKYAVKVAHIATLPPDSLVALALSTETMHKKFENGREMLDMFVSLTFLEDRVILASLSKIKKLKEVSITSERYTQIIINQTGIERLKETLKTVK